MEATFANIGCYLNRPEWQKALQSAIDHSAQLRHRSESTVKLWMILASVPELFRRVTEAVMQQRLEEKIALMARLHILLEDLTAWGAHLRSEDGTFRTHYARRHYKSTTTRYLVYVALANRFLIAIDADSASVTETKAIVFDRTKQRGRLSGRLTSKRDRFCISYRHTLSPHQQLPPA